MSNYPEGMSILDLLFVGESSSMGVPEWFEELISDEYAADLQDLWDEYIGYEEIIDGYYINAETASAWLNEYHPEAMNEDCRELVA